LSFLVKLRKIKHVSCTTNFSKSRRNTATTVSLYTTLLTIVPYYPVQNTDTKRSTLGPDTQNAIHAAHNTVLKLTTLSLLFHLVLSSYTQAYVTCPPAVRQSILAHDELVKFPGHASLPLYDTQLTDATRPTPRSTPDPDNSADYFVPYVLSSPS